MAQLVMFLQENGRNCSLFWWIWWML